MKERGRGGGWEGKGELNEKRPKTSLGPNEKQQHNRTLVSVKDIRAFGDRLPSSLRKRSLYPTVP